MDFRKDLRNQAKELQTSISNEIVRLNEVYNNLGSLLEEEKEIASFDVSVPKPKVIKVYRAKKTKPGHRAKHFRNKCQDRECGRGFLGYFGQKFCSRPHADREGLRLRNERRARGDSRPLKPGRRSHEEVEKGQDKPLVGPEPKNLKKTYTKKCANCGNQFEGWSPNSKYCKKKCYQEAVSLKWAKGTDEKKPTVLLRGDNISQ